jgi:tRNA A58 N-methylase Trm61
MLRSGQKLKIRIRNILDIGSILETWHRKVYISTPLNLSANPDPIVIDVGASIGDFSIYCASSFTGGKVLSYEPAEDAFEILKENIYLNGMERKIKLYPFAVSGHGGKIEIGENIYDAVTLEDILKDNAIERCELLKMDIEGFEYDVLFNTPDVILQRIDRITMECHVFDNGQKSIQLKSYLTERGFKVETTKVTSHNIYYLNAIRT